MDTSLIAGLAAAVVVGTIIGLLRQRGSKKNQDPGQMPPVNGFVPYTPESTAVENAPAYRPQPLYPESRPEYGMGTVPLIPNDRGEAEPLFAPSSQWDIRNFSLTAISGSLKGSSYSLRDRDCLIGRGSACQIRFPAETAGVSGRHCLVAVDAGGIVTVTDVGSTYGTFLSSGQRLVPNCPHTLSPGDTILLAGLDGPAFLLEQQ